MGTGQGLGGGLLRGGGLGAEEKGLGEEGSLRVGERPLE